MIKEQRHARILSILRQQGVVSVEELRRCMPGVAAVTLRGPRSTGRTWGHPAPPWGAVLLDEAIVRSKGSLPGAEVSPLASDLDSLDAVILPPISGRGSEALRREIIRRNFPFIAESAAQADGAYLWRIDLKS